MKKNLFILILLPCFIAVCNKKKPLSRWYTTTQVETGKKIFKLNCAECHKSEAQGDSNWREPLADGSYPPPPLNGTAHTWHHPLSLLKKTIREGNIPLGGKMPSFQDKLSEEEIEAVIAFFQSKWSDKIYRIWKERGGLKQKK